MIHNNMMEKLFIFFKHYRLAFLSGILVGTSYIPFPPWALLFCYAPLWIFLVHQAKNLKEAFWAAWITQFTLSLIGFHWVAYVSHEFGYFPWPLAVLSLLFFCSFIHLYIPLSALLAWWLRKKWHLSAIQSFLILAILTSLTERIWPSIFPWNLGYPLLWAKIPLYQWADTIGFAGLSSLVLLLNAWLAWLWLKKNNHRVLVYHGLILFILLSFLTVTGHYKGEIWQKNDAEIKFLVAQANIGNVEKVYAEKGQGYQTEIIKNFTSLSQDGLNAYPNTDIIVWPETAFPDYLDEPFLSGQHQSQLFNELRQSNKALLTGAYSKDQSVPQRATSVYNSLFMLSTQGYNLSSPYRKTHLLAFGEYLPLSEQFPILLTWLPFIANFGRGHGPDVLTYPMPSQDMTVKIGGQICYEGLYPNFSRQLSEKGAHLFANVTNDSWFGQPSEPRQHMIMTLARAIENRRPLIRTTNTGISTAILASGQRLEESPLHQRWQGQFIIPFRKNPELTFYVQFGHFDWIILCLALILILFKGMRNAKPHRS